MAKGKRRKMRGHNPYTWNEILELLEKEPVNISQRAFLAKLDLSVFKFNQVKPEGWIWSKDSGKQVDMRSKSPKNKKRKSIPVKYESIPLNPTETNQDRIDGKQIRISMVAAFIGSPEAVAESVKRFLQ